MPEHFDVVVVGGGSGLTAAYWAARDGKSVAVVDARPDALGGTCVNRGCIPTKGLIEAAEVMDTIRGAGRLGIEVPQDQVRVDAQRVFEVVHGRRKEMAASTRKWVEDAFTPFYGRARFVEERVLEMEDGRRLSGDRVFVCTGARPAIPPIEGLSDVPFWTNQEAIDEGRIPERLTILGGGYVGCEFGHFFAALGSSVTVLERGTVLAAEDEGIREVFARGFAQKVRLLEHHEADSVSADGRTHRVTSRGPDDEEVVVEGDALLVATGRRPNTDDLGLEHAGIETDEKGWILVDDHLETTCEGVYAYGDVIGKAMFKHTSSAEGEVAYRNSQGAAERMDYAANPHAVFSDPQIGSVGMTEQACREQGVRIRVAKKRYEDVAKGRIVGGPGLAKLIVEEGTDRILGFHMAGPRATDLIHEVVVAMNAPGAKADLVRQAIHVHPTMPELVRAVFDDLR